MEIIKSKLYIEEFNYIFRKKAECVRGALVSSAFVEGQIVLLTQSFCEAHGVVHRPKQHQEYRQSLNVLEVNRILNPEKIRAIEDFIKERNKAIHGPFKGMTRPAWNSQNKKVVELGRPIIDYLDKVLYPEA